MEARTHPLCGTAPLRRGTRSAAKTAGSAHGPWRLSNSPALAIALSNDFFLEGLGLARVTTSETA